jgi:hypothetical protein
VRPVAVTGHPIPSVCQYRPCQPPIAARHNGAVVTLLAVCGVTHRDSYLDIVMVGILGALLALVAVIVLGTLFGSF